MWRFFRWAIVFPLVFAAGCADDAMSAKSADPSLSGMSRPQLAPAPSPTLLDVLRARPDDAEFIGEFLRNAVSARVTYRAPARGEPPKGVSVAAGDGGRFFETVIALERDSAGAPPAGWAEELAGPIRAGYNVFAADVVFTEGL